MEILISLLAVILVSTVCVFYFMQKVDSRDSENLSQSESTNFVLDNENNFEFSIGSGLKFGFGFGIGFFLGIMFLSMIFGLLFSGLLEIIMQSIISTQYSLNV